MGLAAIGHVRDFHVEDVVAGEHAVGRLEVPGVGECTVNWQNTLEALVIMASQDVRLSNGDVNRFNVEDNTLNVVGL